MGKKFIKKLFVIAFALIFTLGIILTGCGNKNNEQPSTPASQKEQTKKELAQGVTDTTVKVGTTLALTGPVAVIGTPMLHGMQAYFNYINDQGGVNGRKIELIYKDDQFNPAVTVQKTQELVEQDKVFALVGTLGTPGLLASMDYIVQKGIPDVYQGSGSSKFAIPFKKNYFPVQPNYTTEGHVLAQYAVDNLNAKNIVIIYQNDEQGTEGLNAIKEQLEKLGKSDLLKAVVPFNTTDVDFSTPVLKAKEANGDVVILLGTAKPLAGIAVKAKEIGYKPQFLASYVVSDLTMFKLAKDAWNGAIVAGWAYPIYGKTENEPKVKLFLDTIKKYFPNETPSGYHVAGWIAAQTFVEGLKRAGDNLTWDGFIKAMETFKDWNEGLAYKLTYTETDHSPQRAMYFMKAIYKNENKYTYEIITDYIEPK
ncbi:ABC transporter substrate-binding protein [Thermoanaerobacter uzonensis]|uniref:ABC transporter substrate-binding protein n=1 Tax=Thermoanaerobacter uzonensis TaxID=447593 RepID=UPI003D768D02